MTHAARKIKKSTSRWRSPGASSLVSGKSRIQNARIEKLLGINQTLIRGHTTVTLSHWNTCVWAWNKAFITSSLQLMPVGDYFSNKVVTLSFNIYFFQHTSTMSVFCKLNLKITTRFPDLLSCTESGFHGDSHYVEESLRTKLFLSFFHICWKWTWELSNDTKSIFLR